MSRVSGSIVGVQSGGSLHKAGGRLVEVSRPDFSGSLGSGYSGTENCFKTGLGISRHLGNFAAIAKAHLF